MATKTSKPNNKNAVRELVDFVVHEKLKLFLTKLDLKLKQESRRQEVQNQKQFEKFKAENQNYFEKLTDQNEKLYEKYRDDVLTKLDTAIGFLKKSHEELGELQFLRFKMFHKFLQFLFLVQIKQRFQFLQDRYRFIFSS